MIIFIAVVVTLILIELYWRTWTDAKRRTDENNKRLDRWDTVDKQYQKELDKLWEIRSEIKHTNELLELIAKRLNEKG
ncbi:MAG: hypothetical protein U9Q90_03860 [Campylobacterota bacterium]|nr:hypothetical protein [Campylobacterota bacterium]